MRRIFPRGAIFFESYDQATGAESLEKRDALTFSGSLSIGACR